MPAVHQSEDPVFCSHRRRRDAEVVGRGIVFMNELHNDHKPHGDPKGGPIHQGHPPYWRNAHRDWRIWCCVILMLTAMVVYLITGDLRWPFHGQSQPMVPAVVGP